MDERLNLRGESLAVVGRLHGLPRSRLERLAAGAGASIARSPGRAGVVVFAHSSAARLLQAPGPFPPPVADGTRLLSERDLRRALGLEEPPPRTDTLSADDLCRLGGLDPAMLRTMRLFDLIDGGSMYGFRDVVAARQVQELLRAGVGLSDIVDAAAALRRRGLDLSEAALTEGPWGNLVRRLSGRHATLDGQLELEMPPASVLDLLDGAEEAEEAGDLTRAEQLYSTAARACPEDPSIAFALGNLAERQRRPREARIQWQRACDLDPAFVDAWYNLGCLMGREGRMEEALAAYRRALAADPSYPDALFNLALHLTRTETYAEALPLWDRYIAGKPGLGPDDTARRAATLCRFALRGDTTGQAVGRSRSPG